MKNRKAMLVLAGAVVFASLLGAFAGCLTLNRGDPEATDGGSAATPTVGITRSTPTTPEAVVTTPTGKATPKQTTPPASPRGPRIVSFTISQQPRCPQGTSEFPVEGTPVTLSWKVTGADQVTLSVDGPGVYDTYGIEGSATINFPCAGEPGETVTHTYLLKTVGGGAVKSKQLTASAEVYEVASV
ncbi:hypothetical protein WEI85_08855 [Actinomycetes bacterium KLBMP 9797]